MITPADGLSEILLKFRVIGWANADADYATLEEFDRWDPDGANVAIEEGEATRLLAHVQADLVRLAKHNS